MKPQISFSQTYQTYEPINVYDTKCYSDSNNFRNYFYDVYHPV